MTEKKEPAKRTPRREDFHEESSTSTTKKRRATRLMRKAKYCGGTHASHTHPDD